MKIAFTTKDGTVRLGIEDDVRWVAEAAGRLVDLEQREDFRALLPLLEENASSVAESVTETTTTHGVAPFPTEELILHALQLASAYWKDLALNWVESLGLWNQEIEQYVGSLAARESKWPQALKHRAGRILRAHAET